MKHPVWLVFFMLIPGVAFGQVYISEESGKLVATISEEGIFGACTGL